MRLPLPPAAALSPQGDEVLPQMSRDAERESGFSRVNERILGSRVSGPAPWEKAPRIRGAETGSGGGQNQGIGAPGEGEGLGAGKEGGLETEWCGWRGWTDERTDGRKEGQVVVAAGLGLTSLAAFAGHRVSAPAGAPSQPGAQQLEPMAVPAPAAGAADERLPARPGDGGEQGEAWAPHPPPSPPLLT